MSKNTNTAVTEKEILAAFNAALKTEAGEKVLIAAMNKMFEDGKWEIPDDAIVGIYARKIDQMQQQIQSLTARMVELSGATAVVPGERIDPLKASKKAKR
jgi:prefoldin subunit 5